MKIVKFKDGRYGIRKGIYPFYLFYNINNNDFWEKRKYSYFNNACKVNNLEMAKVYLDNLTDLGEPVE